MGSLGKLFKVIEAENDEEREKAIKGLDKHHRELIETSDVNSSYLVVEELYDKIIEGTDKVRCMRDVLKDTTFEMPTPSFRMSLEQNTFRILPVVPPTAEYPHAPNQSYKTVTFSASKYGEIPSIEEELIQDSMFDIVEMRLRDIGRVAENTLNQKCIDTLIANATGNANYSSSAVVETLADVIKTMKDSGFSPDTIIMTAEMEGDLFKDPHFRYDYSGETGNFRNQEMGRSILGLKPYLLTVDSANASFGGAIKGVVIDSQKACGLGIRDDVTIDKFEDPRNDLMNLKVMLRFDVQSFYNGAVVNLSS